VLTDDLLPGLLIAGKALLNQRVDGVGGNRRRIGHEARIDPSIHVS
jgi:hypothetical protein